MTHPEELLAPYVDGTASDQERATVDAHLTGCARCRAEVTQATAARTALKGLPVIEAPAGLAPDVSSAPAASAAGAPTWYRWGGIAAAAAAIVLVLSLVLPRLGGGGSSSTGKAAAPVLGGAPETTTAPVPMQIQQVDYGKDALTALVTAADAAATASPVPTGAFGSEQAKAGTPAQARRAEACLRTAFEDVPGTLVRLIEAPFDGKAAYIGLYAEGPGAGQPADTVVARAASVRTCTPLSIAKADLGG
jgi:anti-sigma factor RsiW